jgi:hypothetical protein
MSSKGAKEREREVRIAKNLVADNVIAAFINLVHQETLVGNHIRLKTIFGSDDTNDTVHITALAQGKGFALES